MREQIIECANYIKSRLSGDVPEVAMVLGSGLNGLANELTEATIFSFSELPAFPEPTVEGHDGRMLIGKLDGTPVVCMQGRVHAYEGQPAENITIAPRVLKEIGVKTLILTNASGSLNADAGPGSLMIINDHINFSGISPLLGKNDEYFGPRFQDLVNAWDADYCALLKKIGNELELPISEGVYLMVLGPHFETPAEIRAFKALGADAVGMSTVPECIAARHCGLKVAGVSGITNLGAGMTGNSLSHDETIEEGAKATIHLSRLLKEFIKRV